MSKRDDRLKRIEENLAQVLDLLLQTQQKSRRKKIDYKLSDVPESLRGKSSRLISNVMKHREQITKLTEEGHHIQSIAREIGLNRSTLRLYMYYLGIKPVKAQSKNILDARQYPKVPTLQMQNEYLKQNPWETSEDKS